MSIEQRYLIDPSPELTTQGILSDPGVSLQPPYHLHFQPPLGYSGNEVKELIQEPILEPIAPKVDFRNAQRLFEQKRPYKAREILSRIDITQVPQHMRWQIIGFSAEVAFYFRKFILSRNQFQEALANLPEQMSESEAEEVTEMRVHLAGSYSNLGMFPEARDQYKNTLGRPMPELLQGEVYWGLTDVLFFLAEEQEGREKQESLKQALQYSKQSKAIYRKNTNPRDTALLDVLGAKVRFAQGHVQQAKESLIHILNRWKKLKKSEDRAYVVCAASWILADIEISQENNSAAEQYAQEALIQENANTVMKVYARNTMARVLSKSKPNDPKVNELFEDSIQLLARASMQQRIHLRERTHQQYATALDQQGKHAEAEVQREIVKELEAYVKS